jgi:hypothetical protein
MLISKDIWPRKPHALGLKPLKGVLMKKQGVTRLVLSRETVRALDAELKQAGGGITNITCANSCDTAINSFCYTCANKTTC